MIQDFPKRRYLGKKKKFGELGKYPRAEKCWTVISHCNSCLCFNQGYVTENIPATQRYLQATRKMQLELSSVYRHIILLSGARRNNNKILVG